MLRLLRDWERLQYRQCDYKNHRIFTLRCLHNELVPVSIKLKSTLQSDSAKKILRLAEKQLLQTRLKSISSLLDNNAKQLELTRSKISSILPAPSYKQCQDFIEKVKEARSITVKERWVRKLNYLLMKKEGIITRERNITWQSSQVSLAARASSQAVNRQVTLATRTLQAVNNSQAGRSISPRASPQASQADSAFALAEGAVSQAGNSQTSPADNTLSQAESSVSQAGNFQASLADNTLSQTESAVSQVGIPQAIPAVRCSARLRASKASFNNSQADNTPRTDSAILQPDSGASQEVSSQASASRKQGLPLPSSQNIPQGSSSMEEPNPKWVINLSSKPLTKAQRSVLAKGHNIVVSPRHPPNLEYITTIE